MFHQKLNNLNLPSCLKEDASYLKAHFIHKDPYKFIPLNKGGCSENYILKTKSFAVVIKKTKHTQLNNLIDNLKLAHKAQLMVPKVLGLSPSNTLFLELIKGRSITSSKVNLNHLNQLWTEYTKIKRIPKNKIKKQDVCDWEYIYHLSQEKLKQTYASSSFIRRCLWKMILNIYTFPKSEIVYHLHKTQTIHGDFHNHNILFNHNQLSGILDWENMTIGYACQDWIRYTFYLSERLSIHYQKQQKTKMLFSFLLNKNTFSKAEWALAFDTFLIQKIIKITNNKHLSLSRLFKEALRVRYWEKEKERVLKQVKKLS